MFFVILEKNVIELTQKSENQTEKLDSQTKIIESQSQDLKSQSDKMDSLTQDVDSLSKENKDIQNMLIQMNETLTLLTSGGGKI